MSMMPFTAAEWMIDLFYFPVSVRHPDGEPAPAEPKSGVGTQVNPMLFIKAIRFLSAIWKAPL